LKVFDCALNILRSHLKVMPLLKISTP